MKLSQKTCLRIAYCFFGFKEGYVPVSARSCGEASVAGCIGEESDISCFSVRYLRAVAPESPGASRAWRPYDAGVRKGYVRAG